MKTYKIAVLAALLAAFAPCSQAVTVREHFRQQEEFYSSHGFSLKAYVQQMYAMIFRFEANKPFKG